MKMFNMNKAANISIVLLVSGTTAIIIACAILFVPQVFYASYGIEIGSDANLTNELKSSSGTLLAAGILILAGVFNPRLTFASTATAAALYLSYGLSRLSSMVIDGLPGAELIAATSFELITGLVCVLALLSLRNPETQNLNKGVNHGIQIEQ